MSAPLAKQQQVPPFSSQHLEAISRVLGDTSRGLTGSQIEYFLDDCGIPDTLPDATKWCRLLSAFRDFQEEYEVGTHVLSFIKRAMDPARYFERPDVFEGQRRRLNTILDRCGIELGDDGRLRQVGTAEPLDQVFEPVNRFLAALRQRGIHEEVLRSCKTEIIHENYFHAVFEAMKGVTARIRLLSGLTCDGVDLVHRALGMRDGDPVVAINDLRTDTARGQQRGFVNLLKGLYGSVRNPLAHDPKIDGDMNEQDALDILTTISLVHRRLDKAYRY